MPLEGQSSGNLLDALGHLAPFQRGSGDTAFLSGSLDVKVHPASLIERTGTAGSTGCALDWPAGTSSTSASLYKNTSFVQRHLYSIAFLGYFSALYQRERTVWPLPVSVAAPKVLLKRLRITESLKQVLATKNSVAAVLRSCLGSASTMDAANHADVAAQHAFRQSPSAIEYSRLIDTTVQRSLPCARRRWNRSGFGRPSSRLPAEFRWNPACWMHWKRAGNLHRTFFNPVGPSSGIPAPSSAAIISDVSLLVWLGTPASAAQPP